MGYGQELPTSRSMPLDMIAAAFFRSRAIGWIFTVLVACAVLPCYLSSAAYDDRAVEATAGLLVGGLPSSLQEPAGGTANIPRMLELRGHNQEFGFHLSVPETSSKEYVRSFLEQRLLEEGINDESFVLEVTAKLMTMKEGYDRTHFWFELTAKDTFEEFLGEMTLTSSEHPLSVLEIGSFEGASATWFAENLLHHRDSRLLCLDSWSGSPEITAGGVDLAVAQERFRYNVARVRNRERVQVIKGDSLLSLSALIASGHSSSFDVIYVDASHQLADVLADGILAFRLLKVGGTIIFDDEIRFPDDVAVATATLEQAFGAEMKILHRKAQVVAMKLADRQEATTSGSLVTMHEQGDVPIEKCELQLSEFLSR